MNFPARQDAVDKKKEKKKKINSELAD